MIKSEDARSFIESKKIPAIKKSELKDFSESYQFLGMMIAQLDKKYTLYYLTPEKNADFFIKEFGKDPLFNPWKTEEGEDLAQVLFGAHQSRYIAQVWDLINEVPYQNSYNRRSFRAPANKTHTINKLDYLQRLYSNRDSGFFGLKIPETVQYDTYISAYAVDKAYLFAAALQDEKQADSLYELIKDIFQGEDEIGGVTRNIVKAILLTNEPKNWKLVEDLLLAAQRQEGLRQTILESLDETSLGALQYFIKVILDHNLMRFSSIVRAVDTWFGFNWDAPKSATIKRVLSLSLSLFEEEPLAEKSLQSKDNLEVYVALWFIALKDVDAANLKALQLLESGSKEKKMLACMFMVQTQRTHAKILDWLKPNLGKDIEVDYWAVQLLPANVEMDQELFDKIKQVIALVPPKGKKVEGKVFSWTAFTIHLKHFYDLLILHASAKQIILLAQDISVIPSESRQELMRKIFPDYYGWYHYDVNKKVPAANFKKEAWKRDLVYQAVKDRNEMVMGTALRLFEHSEIDGMDIEVMESMLTRKSKVLRTAIIKLIAKQEETTIKETTSRLVESTKMEQRLAALEILSIQYEKGQLLDFVNEKITAYAERSKLSKNEKVFLDKCSESTSSYSFANGFGVIDYSQLKPLIEPKHKFKTQKKLFVNLVNEQKTVKAVNELIATFIKHQNYEYEVKTHSGEKTFLLLANGINLTDYSVYDKDDKTKLDYMPLSATWIDWYEKSKLNDFELLTAIHYSSQFTYPYFHHEKYMDFAKQYIPDLSGLKLDKQDHWDSMNTKIKGLLNMLYAAFADHKTMLQFRVDMLEDMIVRIPKDIVLSEDEQYRWNSRSLHWADRVEHFTMGGNIDLDYERKRNDLDIDTLEQFWNLKLYLMACKLAETSIPKTIQEVALITPHKKEIAHPSTLLTVQLYKAGRITDTDFQYQCLVNPDLIPVMEGRKDWRSRGLENEILPESLIKELKVNLLLIELERGDLPTEATPYVNKFFKIEGSHYLFNLLDRMGKETFSRGYYWGSNNSKKESFSSLIKKSTPGKEEEFAHFSEMAKRYKLTKKRWMEVAVYAPQWAAWIEQELGVDKLEDAVWWFHAHASDYMNAEKETLIARYSNIEKSDFGKGAIDINWFNEVYPVIGKQTWKLLHDAAKYISDGNGHRLVKLYSGVMLGEVKIRETLAKIKTKRDKDYVRALGLIPLSKANARKDLLTRYNLLQDFLKESKQFGAQRQESEKNAVSIALDNLARNAGFEDSIRFAWAMEGEATQKIMEKSTVTFEDTILQLQVDDQGKADILVTKNNKVQKSIPAKYKKDKAVKALQASKAYLKKQYSRTRLSLENAMLREDEFSAAEISEIEKHPVVKALISKLVFYNKKEKQSGFWRNGVLEGPKGKKIKPKTKDTFVIAHAAHLYENVEWDLYQKVAFDTSLVQPFKQIFRELYVITENEKEAGTKSKRYQGHQIQPQKTVALLRSRGWTVNHEEGLQKVYHKKGFIATMYAMADWYSPADVEAPALEYVCFHSRKDYKLIPLKDIDPVTFSEVMRDVDLVVSVAHVGGVDPEASHSTMQMRAALARETARLFKADNVSVKERHIIIKGTLADYSIHLGSGGVSIKGLRLSIIPVHSQHRGRIFLPFIDDDPKSAEIISKMKLLSRDNEIKDPTILAQINLK